MLLTTAIAFPARDTDAGPDAMIEAYSQQVDRRLPVPADVAVRCGSLLEPAGIAMPSPQYLALSTAA
ncbi:hypothetical protein QTI66_29955 [Variovorax sp. J22R133]|uniref:hypothetical protein n=1 Tax=Variovorax brevis TaxID=3053503 RepID=UPI002577A7FE|nr:hypothetical protein [Variovorax sp. J22R133]MDM0116381.1 hypothetical protein [Variovorax sp. J22R133]